MRLCVRFTSMCCTQRAEASPVTRGAAAVTACCAAAAAATPCRRTAGFLPELHSGSCPSSVVLLLPLLVLAFLAATAAAPTSPA